MRPAPQLFIVRSGRFRGSKSPLDLVDAKDDLEIVAHPLERAELEPFDRSWLEQAQRIFEGAQSQRDAEAAPVQGVDGGHDRIVAARTWAPPDPKRSFSARR